MSPRYQSATAFHQALEERLRQRPGLVHQHRDVLAIQRLLVRIASLRSDVVLKGGMGLKVRTPRARATKDLDLRLEGEVDSLEMCLRDAAQLALGDHLAFVIRYEQRLAGVEGHRFRAECTLGGRLFSTFDIDVVRPEPIYGAIEELPGADWLSFADIPTPVFRVYPLATQLAEKLHALTAPRSRPNTRVKDLPDVLLLASLDSSGDLAAETLAGALRGTFASRGTHEVPACFPEMPPEWSAGYSRIIQASLLPWTSFPEAVGQVRRFVDPVLGGSAQERWSPNSWAWEDRARSP